MKRRPAWFYEWTEAPAGGREWRFRAFWQQTFKNSITVKLARTRWVNFPRNDTRNVWVVYSKIPRIDVVRAVEAGISCRLPRDPNWPAPWTPQRCAEVLVALDAWLEQSPTT